MGDVIQLNSRRPAPENDDEFRMTYIKWLIDQYGIAEGLKPRHMFSDEMHQRCAARYAADNE